MQRHLCRPLFRVPDGERFAPMRIAGRRLGCVASAGPLVPVVPLGLHRGRSRHEWTGAVPVSVRPAGARPVPRPAGRRASSASDRFWAGWWIGCGNCSGRAPLFYCRSRPRVAVHGSAIGCVVLFVGMRRARGAGRWRRWCLLGCMGAGQLRPADPAPLCGPLAASLLFGVAWVRAGASCPLCASVTCRASCA